MYECRYVLYGFYLRVCSVFLPQDYKCIHIILNLPEISQIKHLQYQRHVVNLFIWVYMYRQTTVVVSVENLLLVMKTGSIEHRMHGAVARCWH
jgi:hypothetical protein